MSANSKIELVGDECVIARRQADGIYVTSERVISGDQNWPLEAINWIHGSLNSACGSRVMFKDEKVVHHGKWSLWILFCLFFISNILAIIWFAIWIINGLFKVGPHWTYQLVLKVGDQKVLVMEDVRRSEVKRLGLAINYAWRLKRRDLQLLARKTASDIDVE